MVRGGTGRELRPATPRNNRRRTLVRRVMRRVSRIRSAALTLLICVAGAGSRLPAQRSDAPPAVTAAALELTARFDSLRIALRIPGLAVVVLRDTSILLARGYGLADVERNVPVTPETPFNTASVAKPISAVVALRLVEDGLLDLDRPMRRYRDFVEFCENARGNGGIFFGDFACTDDRLTLRHVLAMTANGERPGTRFWYNPPSYSWASRPMAEVAGRTFSELVDSLVFRPAGMRNAARTNRNLPLPPRIAEALATPYHLDSAGRVVKSDPPPPQGDGAAGGVIASAMDLARFDIALMNGRLLSPDVARSALDIHAERAGPGPPVRPRLVPRHLPRSPSRLAYGTLGGALLGALPQGAGREPRGASHADHPREQRCGAVGDAARRGRDRTVAVREGVLRGAALSRVKDRCRASR